MSITHEFEVQDERSARYGLLYYEHVVSPEMGQVNKAGLRIYMLLVTCANRQAGGQTDPKQTTMAQALRYHVSSIERGIRSLKDARLIRVRQHPRNPYRVIYTLVDPPSLGGAHATPQG